MNAKQLRNAILQQAIEGRLVPQDPTDEPASVLLKRIHAEKQRLMKEGKLKKQKPLPPVTDEEKPFEIPESWEWVRLGEISSNIHYGFTASASTKGNAKLLRITDIQNNTVNWDNVPFCNIKEKDFLSYKLMNGDILIARTGGTIGKTYLVQNLHENSVFASYLIRVSLFSTIFEKFIYSFMNSPLYWQQLKKASMGTGQPNVNGTALSNLCFPLPPLAEQKRIVAKLEEILPEVNDYGNKQDELVKQESIFPDLLRKSLLQEAIEGRLVSQNADDEPASVLLNRIRAEKTRLVKEGKLKKQKPLPPVTDEEKPFEIPESWEWVRLGEIAEYIQRGKSPQYAIHSSIPVLSQKCVQWAGIDWNPVKFIKENSFLTYSEKRNLKRDDLLWNSTGTGTLGRMCLFSPNSNYKITVADSHITIIRVFKKHISARYINNYIKSHSVQKNIERQASGSTNQKELSLNTIQNYPVPLPPLAEQQRIVAKLEELFPLCSELDNHNNC